LARAEEPVKSGAEVEFLRFAERLPYGISSSRGKRGLDDDPERNLDG